MFSVISQEDKSFPEKLFEESKHFCEYACARAHTHTLTHVPHRCILAESRLV